MRMNKGNSAPQKTHEGAPTKTISSYQMLRRTVLSCLLWEDEFYESGKSIAERITETAKSVETALVYELAVEARKTHGLRHVPLLLLLELVRRANTEKDNVRKKGIDDAIASVITRPDEITELLALYWKDGKKPLSAQLKKGLAKAFSKFNEYSLAKYNRDNPIKLRDVMFLSHPKPAKSSEDLYARLANKQLITPDTWEVALSGGADKKQTFERLLKEGNLGYLALLRNLRNMVDAGCDRKLVNDAIVARKGANLVFPFRYVAAARHAPMYEPALDTALLLAINELPKLSGTTIVLVDVSGSMGNKISGKSDITRMDAAATLASIIPSNDLRVFSFSSKVVEVPPRKGMAGVQAIISSQNHNSTNMADAIRMANNIPHDRLIVITDEQANSAIPNSVAKWPYMINVASARNGVGYGSWIHLDGFSESIIRYISVIEQYLNVEK